MIRVTAVHSIFSRNWTYDIYKKRPNKEMEGKSNSRGVSSKTMLSTDLANRILDLGHNLHERPHGLKYSDCGGEGEDKNKKSKFNTRPKGNRGRWVLEQM